MFCKALLAMYNDHSAFWQRDDNWAGFGWLNADDADHSVYSMARYSDDETIIAVVNMTPVERFDYWLTAPIEGTYKLILNSDDRVYGGQGTMVNSELVTDTDETVKNRIRLTLPPLSVLFYKLEK